MILKKKCLGGFPPKIPDSSGGNWGVFSICKDIQRHSQIGCFTMLRQLWDLLFTKNGPGIWKKDYTFGGVESVMLASFPYGVLQVENPEGANISDVHCL